MKACFERLEMVDNELKYVPIEVDKVEAVGEELLMAIDGSVTNTGICIMGVDTRTPIYLADILRNKGIKGEGAVEYKVELKKLLKTILERNKSIRYIHYEEPILGYATSIPALMMLKTSIEELIIENKPSFDYIKFRYVNNQWWKSRLLRDEKIQATSELQKQQIREKVVGYFPYMADKSQDKLDSVGIAIVGVEAIQSGEEAVLYGKKKGVKFGYEIDFVMAYNDEEAMEKAQEYIDKKAPRRIKEAGVKMGEAQPRGRFDTEVYQEMGVDDVALILKVPIKYYGNVMLKYKLKHIVGRCEYAYAVIWRKNKPH